MPRDWPADLAATDFLHQLRIDGVAPLVLDRLGSEAGAHQWPAEVITGIEQLVFEEVAHATLRDEALRCACTALSAHGIAHAVLKGGALAHLLYAEPWHRPSADVDILVAAHQLRHARATLAHAGWCRVTDGPDSLTAYQETWNTQGGADARAGSWPALDLHWQISNVLPFQKALPTTELLADTLTVGASPTAVRTLSLPALFAHTCVHRIAHRHSPMMVSGQAYTGERLIWLEDIRRLARRLTENDWDRVVHMTARAELEAVVADALDAVRHHFHEALVPGVLQRFASSRAPLVTRLLMSRHPMAQHLAEFVSLSGARERVAYLVAHGLPSARYMRESYAPGDPRPLPLLHARRLWSGLMHRLSRGSAG